MTTAFVKMPKPVLKSRISSDAKIVYLCLLDRFSLSQKNGWKDEKNKIYIIFPLSEVMDILECSKSKASKILSELDGLITRKRRGLGKPDIIYINTEYIQEEAADMESAVIFESNSANETQEESHSELLKSCEGNSKGIICETTEVQNSNPNNNNINNNKINKNNLNNPSNPINPFNWIEERIEYAEFLKEKIEYNALIYDRKKEIIDEILTAMVNAICLKKDFIRISGEDIPQIEVKDKFLKMNQSHIEYVYDCLTKNKSPVKNMSAYLLTCLYRAPDVINIHYANLALT